MGGIKGECVFTAAYTVINEFEEVRAHSLTLTKSLSFVKDMFDGVQQGLKDSQNPPTELVYTDSPQSELASMHQIMILIVPQLNDLSTSQLTVY